MALKHLLSLYPAMDSSYLLFHFFKIKTRIENKLFNSRHGSCFSCFNCFNATVEIKMLSLPDTKWKSGLSMALVIILDNTGSHRLMIDVKR